MLAIGRSEPKPRGARFDLPRLPQPALGATIYALLKTLGLDPESVGDLPVAELRQRLSDPRIRRQLDGDAQLSRYVPILLAMIAAKPTTSELSLA